jgi:hypothetical protein
MRSAYRTHMGLDIGSGTIRAAAVARDALLAGTHPANERGMAAVAERALFAEALLGALKARVAEWKTVAK